MSKYKLFRAPRQQERALKAMVEPVLSCDHHELYLRPLARLVQSIQFSSRSGPCPSFPKLLLFPIGHLQMMAPFLGLNLGRFPFLLHAGCRSCPTK